MKLIDVLTMLAMGMAGFLVIVALFATFHIEPRMPTTAERVQAYQHRFDALDKKLDRIDQQIDDLERVLAR